MSLINPVYREQILDGIRADGVEVHEVVLTLPEEQLRVRIDADSWMSLPASGDTTMLPARSPPSPT